MCGVINGFSVLNSKARQVRSESSGGKSPVGAGSLAMTCIRPHVSFLDVGSDFVDVPMDNGYHRSPHFSRPPLKKRASHPRGSSSSYTFLAPAPVAALIMATTSCVAGPGSSPAAHSVPEGRPCSAFCTSAIVTALAVVIALL